MKKADGCGRVGSAGGMGGRCCGVGLSISCIIWEWDPFDAGFGVSDLIWSLYGAWMPDTYCWKWILMWLLSNLRIAVDSRLALIGLRLILHEIREIKGQCNSSAIKSTL